MTKTEQTVFTYDARILGKLWMPQCYAADHRTIPADELCQMAEYDDDMARADVVAYLDTHTGDFSSVEAIDLRRVETHTTFEVVDGWERSTRAVRFTQLLSFTDDDEQNYQDCMFPEDENYEDETE